MALTPGTRLGPYEVAAQIGEGGMGQVYRATDTTLGRQVAIKILPDAFASDPERLARFEREAKTLASLNHPNIAAIYGFEKSGGMHALVMELVEGDDLSQRIARGAIPIDEALPIAKQIAEALEAAHEHGIIHRDLKPANIKVRPDGAVKVLDFGLAKALENTPANPTLSDSPTLSVAATNAGIVLGTAAYMSPEQAKGRTVDRRTDIFAFGCVLYEMLTGRPAFDGEDVTEILGRVVTAEPEWSGLPTGTPPSIKRLIRRALKKHSRQRLGDIRDARIEIEDAIAEPLGSTQTSPATPKSGRLAWLVTAASIALLIGTWGWAGFHVRSAQEASPMRLSILTPQASPGWNVVALSPDGRRVTFVGTAADGKSQLFLRNIDALKAVPITGTEGADLPFWSPDNRFIGFFADGKIKKIDLSGGAPQTVCESNGFQGGTWSREGVILFSTWFGGVKRVPDSGGTPSLVTELDSLGHEIVHAWPHFLPDGRHFLYLVWGGLAAKNAIYVASLDSKDRKLVVTVSSMPAYTSGYLLFTREATLLAQAFDSRRLQLAGSAFPVAEDVSRSWSDFASFSVSDNGILAYRGGGAVSTDVQLTWYDRSGKPLESIGGQVAYQGVDLSPDGRRIAAHRHDGSGGDIWLLDGERGTNSRFTFEASQDNSSPIWSPDGSQIAFSSIRGESWALHRKPSNGAGNEELLFQSSNPKVPMAWSPDGKNLLYWELDSKTGADIWVLPLSGDRKPYAFARSKFSESHPQFSPDGKWVAYSSDESGKSEIYVQPFPPTGPKWQISTNGGFFPRWRGDGRELYYTEQLQGGKIMADGVSSEGGTFKAGSPKPLFESPYVNFPHAGWYHTFAVSADGQRFLIPRTVSRDQNKSESQPITVVVNWTATLKK